jgi:hypothetical protein
MSSSRDDSELRRDAPAAAARGVPRVWLAELEPALASLLAEWLGEAGMQVLSGPAPDADLLVVGVPFPRQGMPSALRSLVARCPSAPVLAMSGTLLGSVDSRGATARALGVSSLLATPVGREAWLAEVNRLLGRTP